MSSCETRALRPGRYAAIDIGTVTCRMLVADVDANGRVVQVAKTHRIVNLGEGVDASGLLKQEAMDRTVACVADWIALRDELDNPEQPLLGTVAVATSASRDAQNAGEFRGRLAQLGVELAVIPGSKEAALSFQGASSEAIGAPVVVVDVGGGSTEVIAGVGGMAPCFAQSFDVGSRRLTERYLHTDPPAAEEIEQAAQCVREAMREYVGELAQSGYAGGSARVLAVAGTATSIVSVRDQMAVYDSARVHMSTATMDDIEAVLADMAKLTVAERRQVVGLDPGRAEVFVAGTVVVREVLRLLGCDEMTVSESDILQGLVVEAAAGRM